MSDPASSGRTRHSDFRPSEAARRSGSLSSRGNTLSESRSWTITHPYQSNNRSTLARLNAAFAGRLRVIRNVTNLGASPNTSKGAGGFTGAVHLGIYRRSPSTGSGRSRDG